MTGASPLAFPGSRVLAGWWKQLAPLEPRALWAGHLFVHHVEALVAFRRSSSPDPFTLLVLRALALAPAAGLEQLDARLHLGPQLLLQVLRQLEQEGLARALPGEGWLPTPPGREALATGSYPHGGRERRTFHFVEAEAVGRPGRYVALRCSACSPRAADAEPPFPAESLAACVREAPAWKQQHGFPLDVTEVLALGNGAPDEAAEPPAWQRVILDRPEQLAVAVVLAPRQEGGEHLLGFPVRPEGWVLLTDEPAFTLPANGPDALPGLSDGVAPEAWRRAWQTWCQPRGLPAVEVDACLLEQHDYRLRVAAPRRLIERLRAARSDAFKNEAWLLADGGRLRRAARIEIVEAAPRG